MLQINVDGLRNVNPKIENARKQIMSAQTTIAGINIPGDFEQAGQLKAIPQKLYSIFLGLSGIGGWVEKSINEFEVVQRKANEIVNSLFGTYSVRKNYYIKC